MTLSSWSLMFDSSLFEVMTFIAVSIGQIFHAVPDAAGGLPLDDYASILA